MKKRTLPCLGATLLALACCSQLFGQLVVNMPFNTGPASYIIGGAGTLPTTFYDNGGLASNYSNGSGANSVVTFVPLAACNCIRVSFSSFQTESSWDPLYIYNGNSDAAPPISDATSNISPATPIAFTPHGTTIGGFPAGGFWGTDLANRQVFSTDANGSLTFRFRSDASVTLAGWVADVVQAPCANNNPETCDGLDNNCNGLVDEGFDPDGDNIASCFDNCPNDANPDQLDYDGDGIGNPCDPILSVCSAIDLLIAQIQGSNIPNGIKNPLTIKLNQAKSSYQNGNNNQATNKLNQFITMVQSQPSSNIPTATANAWIANAQFIINAINNGNHNCTISQGVQAPVGGEWNAISVEGFDHIRLFPNPTTGELTLELKGAMPTAGTVQIFDLLGKGLLTEALLPGQQQHQLTIDALPSGVYFVKVTDGGELVWMLKIVKH